MIENLTNYLSLRRFKKRLRETLKGDNLMTTQEIKDLEPPAKPSKGCQCERCYLRKNKKKLEELL